MDATRFDTLSRQVAIKRTRRGLLTKLGLGGAAAAGAVMLPAAARDALAADIIVKLQFRGHVRVGPDKLTEFDPGSDPGELSGAAQITIHDDGSIRKGTLDLDDGTSFSIVGHAIGRSLSLRMESDDGWLLIAQGVGERVITDGKGVIDGTLIGPEPGDLGDWHASLSGGGSTGPVATATTTGTSGITCPSGQTKCGDICVDLMTDANNCGACGNACAGDGICVDGVCHCEYGPGTCLEGYVWREAVPGDMVCVTGEQRDQAAYDNSQAASRVNPDCAWGVDSCQYGYVWREAVPGDVVCVTAEVRDQVAYDNTQAASRIDPAGAYGPDSCVAGFVWREAVPGDHVCVTGEQRDQAAYDNSQAAARVNPDCAWGVESCLPGYVWREAVPGDTVCVPGEVRDQVAYDNSVAGDRVDPLCP